MSLNSVNTNIGAIIALKSLNVTSSQLAAVQKQISTGYRVADATDQQLKTELARRSAAAASAAVGGQPAPVERAPAPVAPVMPPALDASAEFVTSLLEVIHLMLPNLLGGVPRRSYTLSKVALLSRMGLGISRVGHQGSN